MCLGRTVGDTVEVGGVQPGCLGFLDDWDQYGRLPASIVYGFGYVELEGSSGRP